MTPDRKRVLVLGATGMLGHRLWAEVAERFEAAATVRGSSIPGSAAGVLDPARTLCSISVSDPQSLDRALAEFRPDAVVNCIGMVKQRPEADDPVALMEANSLFPYRAEAACARHGARLIQISTDCVFSGRRGSYAEDDVPDPIDLYGRSKLAGEPEGAETLVLRTSMIGRELDRASGLLEWFLAQDGKVSGFPNAIFSGPTTPVLSRLICDLIEGDGLRAGRFHVGADRISKFELLGLVRDAFGLTTEIEPDPAVRIDRSLDASLLRDAAGWHPPAWPEMIQELAKENGDADR
jgi:dTDP-4-dehydrorhamnose reductase